MNALIRNYYIIRQMITIYSYMSGVSKINNVAWQRKETSILGFRSCRIRFLLRPRSSLSHPFGPGCFNFDPFLWDLFVVHTQNAIKWFAEWSTNISSMYWIFMAEHLSIIDPIVEHKSHMDPLQCREGLYHLGLHVLTNSWSHQTSTSNYVSYNLSLQVVSDLLGNIEIWATASWCSRTKELSIEFECSSKSVGIWSDFIQWRHSALTPIDAQRSLRRTHLRS